MNEPNVEKADESKPTPTGERGYLEHFAAKRNPASSPPAGEQEIPGEPVAQLARSPQQISQERFDQLRAKVAPQTRWLNAEEQAKALDARVNEQNARAYAAMTARVHPDPDPLGKKDRERRRVEAAERDRPRTLAELIEEQAPPTLPATMAGAAAAQARHRLEAAERSVGAAERNHKTRTEELEKARQAVSDTALRQTRAEALPGELERVIGKRSAAENALEAAGTILAAHRSAMDGLAAEHGQLEQVANAEAPAAREAVANLLAARQGAAKAAQKIAAKLRSEVAPLLAAYDQALHRVAETFGAAAAAQIVPPRTHNVVQAIGAELRAALGRE